MTRDPERRRWWIAGTAVIGALVAAGIVLWLWWGCAFELLGDREGLQAWVAQLGP